MKSTHRYLHLLASAILAVPMMLASAAAFAGKTQVEFKGDPDSNAPFGDAGDAWVGSSANCGSSDPASCGVTFIDPTTSSEAIHLGFKVNIGGILYDAVYINSSGFLSFTDTTSSTSPPPYKAAYNPSITTISGLAGEVGAPIIVGDYANLGIPSVSVGTINPAFNSGGGAVIFRAKAIPDVTGPPPPTTDDLVLAFAAAWFTDPDFSGGIDPQVATQLVLYSTDNHDGSNTSGDFAVRLRYGNQSELTYNGALAGYSLGNEVNTATNPSGFSDYFASFVGGVLSSVSGFDSGGGDGGGGGGGTVSAPEMDPASAASGLTLLFGALTVLRGRRRPASRKAMNA